MKVVLCVKDRETYRVTAYAQLKVATRDLEEIKGQSVEFSLERDMGDFPFLECPLRCAEGVLRSVEHKEFYEFRVVKGAGKQGWLRIGEHVSVSNCVAANA